MRDVKNIKTVKAGQEYYATVNDTRLHYMLNDAQDAVLISSKDCRYGGYLLERFGGKLSPDGIRKLHA